MGKYILIVSFILSSQFVYSKSCQNYTAKDWDNEIKKSIEMFFNYQGKFLESLENKFSSCSNNLKELSLKKCFDRPIGYLKQFKFSSGGMYSAIYTDSDYLARQPQKRMELPIELNNGLPKNWKEIAKTKNWNWAHFHSYIGERGALVFHIPGENQKYDMRLIFTSEKEAEQDPMKYNILQHRLLNFKKKIVIRS